MRIILNVNSQKKIPRPGYNLRQRSKFQGWLVYWRTLVSGIEGGWWKGRWIDRQLAWEIKWLTGFAGSHDWLVGRKETNNEQTGWAAFKVIHITRLFNRSNNQCWGRFVFDCCFNGWQPVDLKQLDFFACVSVYCIFFCVCFSVLYFCVRYSAFFCVRFSIFAGVLFCPAIHMIK